jgi:hypothetical protein
MPVTTRFDKALLNLDAVHQTIKTRLTTWRYSRPNITSETLLLAQGENVAGIAGDDQRVAEKEVKQAEARLFEMRRAAREMIQKYVDDCFDILEMPDE